MHLWVNKKSFASAFCAGIKCLIYHKGQPSKKRKPKCTNCWGEHWRSQCSEKKRCRICLKTDHEPGSEKCEAFVENQKYVISFAGADNPCTLSNFFPCTIHVFGIHHRSAEHAFQYVKAIRCGDLSKASAIQAAETALDAKMISKTIQINDEFIDKQEKLMKEIVNAKYDQVEAFREILDKQEQSTLFAESVYDDFWVSGLSKAGTEHTDHRKWPRQNILGQIFRKIVSSRRPAPDPSLFIGICRQPHSVIFQTCWIRFGNPTKELISSRLLCKTTLGLRVNLCGPTGTKMRATKTPMSPLSEKNRWVRTMIVVSARS